MRVVVVDGRRLHPPSSGGSQGLVQLTRLADVELSTGVPPHDLVRLLQERVDEGGDVVVIDGRLVAHGSALRSVVRDPRWASALLVGRTGRSGPSDRAAVLAHDDAILTVGSPLHQPLTSSHRVEGVVKLAEEHLPAVVSSLQRLERHTGVEVFAAAVTTAPVEVVASAAVTAGVVLQGVPARNLVAVRPSDDAERSDAQHALSSTDEDAAWLANAVKAEDGWFATFFVSSYSRYIARWCARRGLSPDLVTMASLLAGVAAAASFATGSRAGMVAGAIVLQAAFALDCVDGQLARYTQGFTAFGSWLDSMADRVKEYVVYAGLALGGTNLGEDPIWILALTAMAVQVVRHSADLGFASARPRVVLQPAELLNDGRGAVKDVATVAPADHEGAGPPQAGARGLLWLKRILGLPIGERFAVISILAVLSTPRVVFAVLIVWGAISVGVRALLQVQRSRRNGWGLGWVVPVLPRVVEVVSVAGIAAVVGHAETMFAYLSAVALRFYDASHRGKVLGHGALLTPFRRALDAWYLRLPILFVVALLGIVDPVGWILAGAIGVLVVADIAVAWLREPHDAET